MAHAALSKKNFFKAIHLSLLNCQQIELQRVWPHHPHLLSHQLLIGRPSGLTRVDFKNLLSYVEWFLLPLLYPHTPHIFRLPHLSHYANGDGSYFVVARTICRPPRHGVCGLRRNHTRSTAHPLWCFFDQLTGVPTGRSNCTFTFASGNLLCCQHSWGNLTFQYAHRLISGKGSPD